MNKISFSSIANSIVRAKKRTYIFTIIAIILCVFFCSAIVFIAYGTYTSVVDEYQSRYGKYDMLICDSAGLPLDDLILQGVFSDYAVARTWEYALNDEDYLGSGFSITKYDDKYLEIANKQLIEGRYPQTEGEIAIEQSMLGYLKLDVSVGQTITLTIAVPDGESFLDDYIVKDFVITGILKDQYIYLSQNRDDLRPVYFDFPAALVSDDEPMETGGLYIEKCFGINGDSSSNLFTYSRDESSPFYNMYDRTIITYSNYDSFRTALQDVESSQLFLTALFLGVLGLAFVFVSAAGISSAFSANLNQRKKQIGMLRAVGATARQIAKITFQEIIIVSVVSVPTGILLSVAAIKIFSGHIGNMFEFTVNMHLLLVIIIFSIICIMFSVIRPMNMARKISPMQAIRDQEMSLKLNKKQIKSKNEFIVESHLSKRKTVLHKTHIGGVSVLVALTVIVLLIGVGYSSEIIESYIGHNYGHDYAISSNLFYNPDDIVDRKYNAPGFNETDKQDMLSVIGDGVVYANKMVKAIASCEYSAYMDIAMGDYAMQNPASPIHEQYLQYKSDYNIDYDFIGMTVMAVDDEIIKGLDSFVYDGQIDMDKLNSGEHVLVFEPQSYGIYYQNGGSVTGPVREGVEYAEIYYNDVLLAGKTLEITLLCSDGAGSAVSETVERIDNTVTIGAVAYYNRRHEPESYMPFLSYPMGSLALTTYEGFENLGYETSYNEMFARLNYVPDEDTKAYINTALKSIAVRVQNTRYTSYIDAAENDKRILNRMIGAALTLFIIFAVMSIVMINNAISSQIRSDQKTIGTLCAVGATLSTINKVYLYEIVHILKTGLIAGIAASAIVYIVITIKSDPYYALHTNYISATVSLIIFVILLIAICGISVYKRTRQIKQNSIVSNIRQL